MTLKDFTKKQLFKMRTAVRTTRALHEKAVKTGESYQRVKFKRRTRRLSSHISIDMRRQMASCPLCEFRNRLNGECRVCPWKVIKRCFCADLCFNDSLASITRLTRWEALIQTEIDARAKK